MYKNFLLDPKVDFVFKNLFFYEEKSDILISFVNSILGTNEISELKLEIYEKEKHFLDDKFSRIELKGKNKKNEDINIEIRLDNQFNIINRSIYSWCKLYDSDITERGNCSTLKRTIGINILNKKEIENNRFHNAYRLKEIETNEELTDIQEIHYIEIEKVENSNENTILKAWIEFLKNPESEYIKIVEEQYIEIKKAKEILIKLSNDTRQREFYELREKMIQDKLVALNNTKKLSHEKGLEEGLELGKEKGIEEGKMEAKFEIARNLLDVLDDWTISIKTGLSINEIKEMRK
jgi:predicted transposase/invertase (TIGR01784 family)